MKDWDVPLYLAIEAAAQAAEEPLLCELLKMAREGKELPLALPAEGMARLLDVAILTGDRDAQWHVRFLNFAIFKYFPGAVLKGVPETIIQKRLTTSGSSRAYFEEMPGFPFATMEGERPCRF